MRNDEQGYNGWSNYETWCVSMWLSNDEYNYKETRKLAAITLANYDEGDEEMAVRPLATMLSEYVEELPEVVTVTEGPASFVTDLLGAALSEVDWQEIAENLISEVKE